MMQRAQLYRTIIGITFILLNASVPPWALPEKIIDLTEHFNETNGKDSRWIFVPQDNVREFSTEKHPGLATIWQNGKGKDITGILKDPIPIDAYQLPWEFQLGIIQNNMAMLGVDNEKQINYAIGLNVAVTFSDPATWPKDRTTPPSDMRSFQLLVVHLGSTGEFSPGLPQFAQHTHPETYLLWGRGDLGHNVMGDWQIPYLSSGSGPK
jgi:hypothetical protein